MSLLFLLGEDLHRYCRPEDLDGRIDVPVLQSYVISRDDINWGEQREIQSVRVPAPQTSRHLLRQ